MSLGPPGRRKEPLHAGIMALALAFAAFLGAAIGLVWQSVGLGENVEAGAPPDTDSP